MLRNKEIQVLLLIMGLVTTVGIIGVLFISPLAALFTFIVASLLIICTFIFTKWRYQEIDKLSHYLRKISHGEYTLDVRDHHEGELSILKSDIYKVTTMLAEHHQKEQQDKVHLTEAISDISHQLKTPLTSMMMMADLLQEEHLPRDKRLEFTKHIQTQLKRIQWLVTSLLKLSKIDAGTAYFTKEQVLVKDVLQSALQPLLIPIELKEIQLTIQSENEPVHFTGDFNWTREALINLLKNAVEHTPKHGKLTIQYGVNALFTEIIISDTGKGIPRNELPYLFQRFYKGSSASEDSVGIGLALSHRIITKQFGDIEVESKLNQGTTFTIKFYNQIDE